VESHIIAEIPEILDIVIHVDPPDAGGVYDEDASDEGDAACT
jgi:hypothetical protein